MSQVREDHEEQCSGAGAMSECVCACVRLDGAGGGAGGSGARRSETLPLHTFMSENLSVTGVPHVMFRL